MISRICAGRPGCFLAPALAGLSILCAAPLARAQFIDRYFPAAVATDVASPALPALTVPRQDVGTAGVHLGTFWITPDLDTSVGYDSNATGQPTPGPSAVTRTDASVAARSDWGRNSVYGYAGVDDSRYWSQPAQNTTDWSALGRGTLDLGRGVASLLVSHLALNETPRDLNVPTLGSPAPYTVDAVRASYATALGPLTVTPGAEYERWRYSDVAGQTLTYQDRDVLVGSLTGRYEIAVGRDLLAVLRGVGNTYVNPQPGVPNANNSGVDALVGGEYDSGVLRLRVLAGGQQRNFADASQKPLSGPMVEATAIWRPTGLTSVTGTFLRTIADSALPNVSAYTLTEARLELDHELRRDVLLQASVQSDNAAYPGGGGGSGGSAALYSGAVGATWLVNRQARLGLSYDYAHRASGSTSFTESIVQFQLHLGL
jgi:hypothetical protein